METDRIKVEGMSCEHCVARVKDALIGLEGVQVESVQIGRSWFRSILAKLEEKLCWLRSNRPVTLPPD